MNKLFFGDCLDILKLLHKQKGEGFIDLVYIDPPFNSKRNYNVLFESIKFKDAKAQKQVFEDTWSNVSYKDTLQEIQDVNLDIFNFLATIDKLKISKGAASYLTTMAIRMWYIHKVLKDTGSFYLHCDSTMSHYLKILCDLIFHSKNFRGEIIWKRTTAHSNAIGYGTAHDTIFYYTKSNVFTWNEQFQPYDEEYLKKYYRYKDDNGRKFMSGDLVGHKGVNKEYEWKGIVRAWRYPKHRLDELEKKGRIFWTKNKFPRYKRYLDEMPGMPLQTIWTDVKPIVSWSNERLGYPTQKPRELMERIISASTNEGDLVADFFCGCGTTIDAAQKLNRKWLGADISHLAVGLIERRLRDKYGNTIKNTYEVFGLPKDIASAKQLAAGTLGGRLKFQDWIIETMMGGVCNPKKTADGGWDGHLTFETNKKETVLIEVKSGNVNVKNLREFIHVVNNAKASIGVFVCFSEFVTKPMELAAKDEGYFAKEFFGTTYDKIQILTVEDLMEGKNVNKPLSNKETFKSAKREYGRGGKNKNMLLFVEEPQEEYNSEKL